MKQTKRDLIKYTVCDALEAIGVSYDVAYELGCQAADELEDNKKELRRIKL